MKFIRCIFVLALMVWVNGVFAQSNGETPAAFLPGDVDGDNKLTTKDVDKLSWMLTHDDFSTINLSVADANMDGKVSIADVADVISRLGNCLCDGHEYVDLGLGVKWATCNVGASRPEECGDYFAWGETEPKSMYNWSTYKWMTPGKSSWDYVTKYTVPDSQYNGIWYRNNVFVGDNKRSLDPGDDAARVNWGGSWRMPTQAELEKLRSKCKWVWTSLNGMNGYKVTGPNGNSIFLPATGFRIDGEVKSVGTYADYWSSTLNSEDSDYAYFVYFNTSYVNWYYYFRYYGQSVRAVCP